MASWVFRGLFVALLACGLAHAQSVPASLQKGIDWLTAQVRADGTLTNEASSVALPLQAREETQVTLASLARVSTTLVAVVAANTDANVEAVARRILGATGVGQPAAAADIAFLLAQQNADGGWGMTADFQSDPLDTAFALQALFAANSTASSPIASGLAYLAQSRSSDGGWGINGQSSVYVTSNVLLAATVWSAQGTSVLSNAAVAWLLGARNAAQSFGDTLANAYALWALSMQPTQSAALPPLATALTAAQSADGSWSQDPYLTALALRALWYASQPPTAPTTGTAQGTVIDQSTGQALAGATLALQQNLAITATSATDGSFVLNDVPPASYTLQVSHAGYQSRSLTLTIVAGQRLALGTIALAPTPTTANVSGIVKDNNGVPLSGVLVAVASRSTLTDASGAYQLTGLPPGTATISASLSGYRTASTSVAFVAGTSYLFSPTLYPTSVTPPAPSLRGTVIDAVTRSPIVGASVTLASLTQTTDASGAFVFASATVGPFSLTVSAAGYQSAVASGTLVAGVNDVGAIALQATPATATLQGRVLDQQDQPIANASLSIDGGPSTTSAAGGAYQLSGVSTGELTLHLSATGYLDQTFVFSVPAPGTYSQDFHLVAQQASALTLGPLTVAPASAGSNTNLGVSTTLVNGGDAPFDGILMLVVRDADGNVLGTGALTDSAGFGIGAITLQAGDHLGIVGRWNTGQFAPGNYQFELRLVQPASVQRATPLGVLIQNSMASFAITPTTHFAGIVQGDPPAIQAGLGQSVHLTAEVTNDGNQPLAAQTLTLTATDAQSGVTAFTATAALDEQPVNGLAALDFGQWQPAQGGNFVLTVTAADPAIGQIRGTQYVGNVAQAAFTVDPAQVLAGTQQVHGNIHVTGADPAQATITDPLAPLMRAATQRAVTYNDTAARTWIDGNRCSSCHIGNQALIGGEAARALTTFNAFDRNVILNTITVSQAANGGLNEGDGRRRLGTLSFWGLLGYHNLLEFPTVIKHAADWVVNIQAANGSWSSDYNGAWFDNDISMAMLNISNLNHALSFFQSNAIASVPVYTTPTLLSAQPASGRAFLTASSTGNLYYTDQSGSTVNLITPAGVLLMKWTGLNDPRSIVELGNGDVWVSTGSGTYKLNADGTSVLLASGNFNLLSVGPDGTTVWGNIWNDRTIYQLDATGKATAWLSGGPFSFVARIIPDSDGSLYVTDNNNGKIYHVLPDKTVSVVVEVMQGSGSPPSLGDLIHDGDHWLLSTSNGIYRFSAAWEGQRITWTRADGLARLPDGTILYVTYGQAGIRQLVLGAEAVAPSLPTYAAAIDKGTQWLQAQTVASNDNLHMAQQLWGLGEAYRFYSATNAVRAASIYATMTTLATRLWANQAADGGWGITTGKASDALVTAQVGIALDYTNPSANDPAIRRAISWLLSQQQPDGSWASADGIMSTRESTTTMVAIWLPTILDRLGGIDAQVSVTLPPNIQPTWRTPAPTTTSTDASGNLTATWALTGVTNAGRDIDFDLTLLDMTIGEVRPAALDAHMVFNNSFIAQAVAMPIAVPDVRAVAPVGLTVTTDQPSYPANAIAQVTTLLLNHDVAPVDGDLLVQVFDANGVLVGTVARQPARIPAGGTLPVTGPFPVGTILPATYTVKAVLTGPGGALAQGQTSFDVLPDDAAAAAVSTLRTDRLIYAPTDRVQILSSVQSRTNALLTNLSLAVGVFDASGAQVFAHTQPIAQLLPQASADFTAPQALLNAPGGVYTVKQDLLGAGGELYHHVETTYRVSSTRDTGFGLTGTIAATPKTARIGERFAFDAAATNLGNADLSRLPLTIYLIDPETGAVVAQFDQISDVPVGGSVPFVPAWTSKGRAGKTYLAILTATVGAGVSTRDATDAAGTTVTLAQDTFQLLDLADSDSTVPVPVSTRGLLLMLVMFLLWPGWRALRAASARLIINEGGRTRIRDASHRATVETNRGDEA